MPFEFEGVGWVAFSPLLFVCVTRDLLNLLLGEEGSRVSYVVPGTFLAGGKELGTLPLPPCRVKAERVSLWTGSPVLPVWKEKRAKHPHIWCHGPTLHKAFECQSLTPKP